MSVIRWIKEISDRFMTKVYNMALRIDLSASKYVPDHLMTQEMCNEAVRIKPFLLKYVPDHLKTQEMYNQVVEKKIFDHLIY